MTRRNEQGNVLLFVIVGVLLTAALVGAVVAVRHFQKSGSDSDTTTTTSTTKGQEENAQSGDGAPTGSQSSNDQALKDALNAQSQAEKNKQSQPVTGGTSSQQKESTTPGGPASNLGSTATSRLPETGPESTFISLLGASLLIGTGFAYARSRRLI